MEREDLAMPTLTLKFKEKALSEYQLEKGGALTIGRSQDNNVVIENLAVSGHHAKIDSVEDGFLLTDLGSTNGSFVNEEIIASHWLKEGDIITIAKHHLVFAYAEGEAPLEDASQMDKTMVMDTKQHRALLEKSLSKVSVPPVKEEVPSAVLSLLAGGQGEVVLSKKLTKIGKDSGCDIVVGGLTVGKTAATISHRPNGYYLSYVGGMAKPKVNGSVVKESVQLNEFDKIEIGSLKAQLVFPK